MFAVTDPDEIDLVLSNARLGCLMTRDGDGFFGTHLPMLYDAAHRTLAGHVSRGNPHPARSGDLEAIIVFQGMDAYVSPNWYPSKFQHGRVVPTWNYEAAHVTGTLIWQDDPVWLAAHLAQMTDRFERAQAKPWALSDAPNDYLERQLAGVVGVELAIRDVRVKRKLSQNRNAADLMGVVAGLTGSDDPRDKAMASVMASAREG